MKHTLYLFFIALLITSLVKAQTKTYTINYYSSGLSQSCNVFSSPTSYAGFEHTTTQGYPSYNSTEGAIELKSQYSSQTFFKGTEYKIKFPFKQGYTYQIRFVLKGAAQQSAYPVFAFALSNSTNVNTSVSCSGPATIEAGYDNGYIHYSGLTSSLSQTNYLYSGVAPSNYNYIILLGMPAPYDNISGVYSTFVREIQIQETAPINPDKIAGKILINDVTGDGFLGIDGKYVRIPQLFLNSFLFSSAYVQQNSIHVNSDPSNSTNMVPGAPFGPFLVSYPDGYPLFPGLYLHFFFTYNGKNFAYIKKINNEPRNFYQFNLANVVSYSSLNITYPRNSFTDNLNTEGNLVGPPLTVYDSPAEEYVPGRFLKNIMTEKVYFGIGGEYKEINPATFAMNFDTINIKKTFYFSVFNDPYPISDIIHSGYPSDSKLMLVKNIVDNKVYLREDRYKNNTPGDGDIFYYRHILNEAVFNKYHFDWNKIAIGNVIFSDFEVLGPPLID